MLYEGNGIILELKGYILSIVSAAVVCAAAKVLLDKKTAIGRIAGMLCGIFMVITVIAPLREITFSGITEYMEGLTCDADTYVQEGKSMYQIHTADIIKTQTEAYILDKATRMGLEISVEVELDENSGNIPCGAVVTGGLSPYAREVLGSYMEDSLGISKEKQLWN